MTILSALTRLYDRLEEEGKAPEPGFSMEKVSFKLSIDANGNPMSLADIRSLANDKPMPRLISVPAPVKRASNIKPNKFWDKSSYVLGVTAIKEADTNGNDSMVGIQDERTKRLHQSFIHAHLELIQQANDPGLRAFRCFLENWTPEKFEKMNWPVDALDQNIVFEFDDGSGPKYIHDRSAVKELLGSSDENPETEKICLVTGEIGPVERLHPSIKGVAGAQSSGASLVSYNDNAYESFGKSQGENAPVSQRAAFSYGTALNTLLLRRATQEQNQFQRLGNDTTVVFWAEAEETETASFHELLMGQAVSPPDDQSETNRLRAMLIDVTRGNQITDPQLDPDTKIYILGLAPNAARLSVRFWCPGVFGSFAENISKFWEDLEIEPQGWKGLPSIRSILYETRVKASTTPNKTISPLLAGEIMRAVLTGQPLPRTLLSSIIRRIYADGSTSDRYTDGRRAAICKAVVNQNLCKNRSQSHFEKERVSVKLDSDSMIPAYRLGRLFAVLESVQSSALPGLNATIKDRYFSSASATPARVFPLLVKNSTHHLALLKKRDDGRLGHWFEKEMGKIWLGLDMDMPRALNLEDQGRFIVGYYHQRWTKTDKNESKNETNAPEQTTETTK
ncbi:MAG: type I-C CRISPR-associated protein Cas8c/Csd1 [Gammaproteobacteria bacterium]|nr:type I-C CRISPR-associated protein Cas8c/Csd1 [Gammaproteobacteria bacterium]MDE0612437.1 type I-C CRISPR-associated protein Cas8c/Csd1 [Gammaproteobacteria bacterium]